MTKGKTKKEIEAGIEFGFTDDPLRLAAAKAYRDAAKQDGWVCVPTYDSESMESASSQHRQHYAMQILSREMQHGHWNYQCSINIWGPDGLSIKPPDVYDWLAITAGARTCNECGAVDVDTQKYSFAGRCCADCRPAMAEKHEKRGWAE